MSLETVAKKSVQMCNRGKNFEVTFARLESGKARYRIVLDADL